MPEMGYHTPLSADVAHYTLQLRHSGAGAKTMPKSQINNNVELEKAKADLKRWEAMYANPNQWPGLKENTPAALSTIKKMILFWERRVEGDKKMMAVAA